MHLQELEKKTGSRLLSVDVWRGRVFNYSFPFQYWFCLYNKLTDCLEREKHRFRSLFVALS